MNTPRPPIPSPARLCAALVCAALLLPPWGAPSVRAQEQRFPAAPAPAQEAAAFLGLPYHSDGVQDENGRWTYFARPETDQPSPGLNCSGLVVSASRKALGRPLPLAEMLQDRNHDSGPGAPGGQDWDFGFDLVLNVSQGLERSVLTPDGRTPLPENADGASLRGFRLDDADGWRRLLPLLRPDRVCLLSFSRLRKGRLLHHHVALLLKDGAGQVWFEQATGKSGVDRQNLSAPGGIEHFLEQQRRVPGTDARVLIIEAVPQAEGGDRPATASSAGSAD